MEGASKPFIWHQDNLAQATQGSWLQPDISFTSQCISADTRKLAANDIFLALQGDNFDGHDYLDQAESLGAKAAIVSQPKKQIDLPQLVVADTRLALGSLGNHVRRHMPALKVVALTGSSGKTTVKEMLGSILSRCAPTLITRGNLNNDLGVPMMLLELSFEHQYAVLELGANHVGEIGYTTKLVEPDVAAVLNIGTAHLGEFGGRDAICQAKSEIFSGLLPDKTAVVPAVDDYAKQLISHAKAYTDQVICFGRDVQASSVVLTPTKSVFKVAITTKKGVSQADVVLPFSGAHNVTNALAAAACAHALGVDIQTIAAGLSSAKPAKGRLSAFNHGKHVIIDDTYNANPQAVLAAAKVLLSYKSSVKAQPSLRQSSHLKPVCLLVLGDIAELGDKAYQEHLTLGGQLANLDGLDALYVTGEYADAMRRGAASMANQVHAFDAKQDMTDALVEHVKKIHISSNLYAVVLVKGSRMMAMETVIKDLRQKISED